MPRPGRSTLAAAAALALLLAAAYWPVVAGQRSFFHFDLYYEHLPIWHATQSALAAGESPFWVEGEYCGHPLLFQQEAPLLYPPMVPLLATGLPVHRLNDAFTLFHFWLAGFLAFLLLRRVGADALSSLFGGVAWMLSARLIQSATWPSAVAVSAYLPAILLGIVWIGRGRRRSGVLTAAVSGGLALLAARPHALLAAAPLLIAVAVGAVVAARPRLRAAADLALAAVLALLLGAPSLLPSALIYPDSSRGSGLSRDERDAQALRPGPDLAQALFPVDGMPRWPEPAAYPGILVAVFFLAGLALLALRREGFPGGLFAAVAGGGLLGLAFAFGEKGPYGLIGWLPPMSLFRMPVRYLLSWSLALAVGSALVLAFWLRAAASRRSIGGACLLLLSADLVMHARRAAPTAAAEAWSVEPEVAGELSRRLGKDALGFPRRFLSVGDLLYPVHYRGPELLFMLRHYESLRWANGMRWGLESVWGDGPTLRRTLELFTKDTPRAAQLGGVEAVVYSEARPAGRPETEARPLAIADAPGLPRALLVSGAIVTRPENAVAETLAPGFDPRLAAVLEKGEPRPARPMREGAVLTGERRSATRLDFDVRMPEAGALVVFNSWEAGWRAFANGEPAEVERADGAFQAVRLPEGHHRVELEYRPRGLFEGLLLGAAGALATILAAMRLRPV